MARPLRSIAVGGFYHVLNRGNGRMALFHKPADYDGFVRVLREGLDRYPVGLMAWCLMANHWHLILSPQREGALADLMRWVGVTHVRRHHEHYHTRGGGHLYQGRFKSFPIQDDHHFLVACRYVEANPLRAAMVKRAENWRWSSVSREDNPARRLPITPWPVRRPANWIGAVNEVMPKPQLSDLRVSVVRGRPFGAAEWVEKTAHALGLTNTLRDPGRPRKLDSGQSA